MKNKEMNNVVVMLVDQGYSVSEAIMISDPEKFKDSKTLKDFFHAADRSISFKHLLSVIKETERTKI